MSGAHSNGQATADPDGVLPDHRLVVEMLDAAPMSRTHYIVWMLATGGTLLDGVSVFMLGLAIPLLTVDLALTSIEVGLLGGALVSGAIAGASIGGRIGDSYGRRRVFIVDMVVVFAAALVGSLGRTPLILIVAQAAVGVGVGMDFPVGSSYVAECMPHRKRTRMMVATIAAQAVGMVTAAVIAVALLQIAGSTHAWRLMFVAQAVIAGGFAISRLGLPESPRWLMSRGENRKALEQLARLVPMDRSQIADLSARLGATEYRVSRLSTHERRTGLAVLFHRRYLRRTLLVTVPWFFMDIATYGVGLFTAVILGAMHLGGHSGSLSQIEQLAAGTGAIDLFLVVGFAVGGWAVGRFGRIRMQILGFRRNGDRTDCSVGEHVRRRRGAHGACLCRVHRLQPEYERRSEQHDIHSARRALPNPRASDGGGICGFDGQSRGDARCVSRAFDQIKIRHHRTAGDDGDGCCLRACGDCRVPSRGNRPDARAAPVAGSGPLKTVEMVQPLACQGSGSGVLWCDSQVLTGSSTPLKRAHASNSPSCVDSTEAALGNSRSFM